MTTWFDRAAPLCVAMAMSGCGVDEGSLDGPATSFEPGTPTAAGALPATSVAPDGEDPGAAVPRLVLPYPAPPYGAARRSTIANYEFFGWSNPSESSFDTAGARRLSLAEFYDPDGTKGNELLFISAVATWCTVCQQEYRQFQTTGVKEDLTSRGAVFLGTLFENQDADPPSFRDLEAWVEAFDVDFPFGADPALKLGVFFDRQATPMNMVVDLKTMEILFVQTGYSEQLYELMDEFLTSRGR